ncbi:30S ribosomal protein S16 [Sedimentisphaera salicampi]|uniref:30S ribosomal protein S16 n=1 Tax=Sedimentisphaera salicampi TaxID=1941349 RepID=UPI000B9BFB86|nr:30S ribosomal protein S16 [Sedimentisphaera salicampi]OXU16210.1 30S ribosomal protein S16 [Sedimentisphaera salicampi]
MAVKLRMTRMGRRHRPFFRINAVESTTPRDGRILEKVGHYDPLKKDKDSQIELDTEKAKKWIDKGAVPSDTVAQILEKFEIECPTYKRKKARKERAKALARKKGVPFTKQEKLAAAKAKTDKAEAAKAEAEAREKAKAEKAEAEKAE